MSFELNRLPKEAARIRVCAVGRCARAKARHHPRFLNYPIVPLPSCKHEDGASVRVQVRLLTKKGKLIQQAGRRIRVKKSQPNGPSCPPTCFGAGLLYDGFQNQLERRY